MKDKLQLAIDIAIKAHEGQLDKGGNPYINHPVYVMSLMETKEQKIVALLHDVIEDTNYTTLREIQKVFGDDIRFAVDAISRREEETHKEYILRCKCNNIAKHVKLGDLIHNMSEERGFYSESLMKRYRNDLKVITGSK